MNSRTLRRVRCLNSTPVLVTLFLLGLAVAWSATAQTQTYPCETVTQFGTGMSTNGTKLRPGSVSPHFVGLGTIFPNAPDTFVLTDPLATWIANSASDDSQWIGPSSSTTGDAPGVYIYYLPIVAPCSGAHITGRYAASDRGAVRLNGAPVSFPTPANGSTTWTPFAFNNLLSGLNRLEFLVTNIVGTPPDATGLRAELTVTATCCPCIELTCPPDIFVTTCSNGALANFSITGTNRCYTNLVINCSLAPTGIPVTPSTVFPVGTNTVLCNASDTVGHRTNCSFRVVVTRDSRAPEIRCPQDIVYLCRGGGTNVFYSPAVADDVDPNPVVTCVPPSGSFFAPGTNQVVCEARDDCGRIGRCSFNVVISPAGFTQTLQAGAADNFSPAGLESPTAGPCLGASGFFSVMPFDTVWTDRHLAHCFLGLPPNVTAAKLSLRMKPTQPASQDDVLRIGLQNCGLPAVWAFAQAVATLPGAGGSWTTNAPTTFVIDLAALPGGGNLLAQLNASQRLEFAVGTDTLVDYARLELVYCGPQGTLSGVPYSSKNVYPIHQGDGGISWRTVNSNSPLTLELDLDIGYADGFRLGFAPATGVQRLCTAVSEFAYAGLTTVWPTGDGTTATVRFDEPFALGTNTGSIWTRVTLDQPSNLTGKMVEVWDDNPVSLKSRYFFPGNDATGVLVPDTACVKDMGFTAHYFFIEFTSPQVIDLKSPAVPATQHGGTLVTGQVGPVVMGQSVRLYFNISVADLGSSAKGPKMSWFSNSFNIPTIALQHGDEWIEPYGPQQISLSDVISWHALPHSPIPSGVCTPAYGPWTIDLNGAIDFCNGDPSSICNVDHVDINLVEEINFGGLRITPGPLGTCTIANTVANSPFKSITLNGPGGPMTFNGVTLIGAESLPQSISGSSGPQAFTVVFPPNTFVFSPGAPGGSPIYTVTSVTFHSQPQVLGQFYQVCVETTFNPLLVAPKFSFGSFQTFSQTIPPTCLTFACPTNVIVHATNEAGAVVTFNPSGATRCGSNVVVTCEPPSGSVFPPGPSVVVCSAIDNQGSQDNCHFLVTVIPPLRLRAAAGRPDLLELRWKGDAVPEFKDSLSATLPWREVTSRTESNGVERLLRLAPNGDRRFFRLRSDP